VETLGTITKYYPFIDEESKSILNSLMDESSNYFDFVHRLAKLVLEKESSNNLVYIAATQCWYASDMVTLNPILDKYNSLTIVKPWRYYWGTHESYKFKNCQAILESLNSALKPPTDSWIAAELLLAHAYNLAVRPEGAILLTKANVILDRQPELLCFKPLAYIVEGCMNHSRGKVTDVATSCRKAYELAHANDDSVYEFFTLLLLGDSTKNKSPHESIDLFEQAYQIAQDLGAPVFIGETLHSVGLVYEILGEYDLAIPSQLECITEVGTAGSEIIFAILSRLYASLGQGQQSLEWADRCLEDKEFFLGYLRKARALIILDRFDEAEALLEIAGRKVLQSGFESYLSRYHFVSGLLDMARGEYVNAMGTLEQAYEILYPMERLVFLNEVLIALAKGELALHMQSRSSDEPLPGKWLSILENHARTFDMPGVAMQAALLRAEVFKSQGQLRDAHETLQRALELSDSPGVKTMRKRIESRIQEISRLMHDEGLVS
jgi:tetratricopeptide (TPR) repeat protein